jgi:hypothetical protein
MHYYSDLEKQSSPFSPISLQAKTPLFFLVSLESVRPIPNFDGYQGTQLNETSSRRLSKRTERFREGGGKKKGQEQDCDNLQVNG